jgi:hypothetical protein
VRFCRSAVWLLLAVAVPLSLKADILTFEGFSDSTSLTTQYPGLTFTSATVITAGITLNEFEFPPHSGVNVVFDDGGPMSILFDSPVLSFSGFFTYSVPLTLAALDATSTEVASAVSAFSSNDALFGDLGSSPNEFLQLSFAAGISSITISGDPLGGSFVLDDAAYTSAVPEPASFVLMLTALGGVVLAASRKRQFHS